MPRRPRVVSEDLVFHVYNRAIQSMALFTRPSDYDLFLGVIREALQRVPVRLLAYVLMPNHWHFVLWPGLGQSLADLMKWVTGTHVQWHRMVTGTRGRGALYQGRYKAIPVDTDTYFYNLIRYVQRNPVRKGLVVDVHSWRWSSAWPRPGADHPALSEWPVPRPKDWEARLSEGEYGSDLDEIRTAISRSIPYGRPAWQKAVVKRLGWPTGLERPGRRWPQNLLSSAPDPCGAAECRANSDGDAVGPSAGTRRLPALRNRRLPALRHRHRGVLITPDP